MNHDILILTTGTRQHLYVQMLDTLNDAIARAHGQFRITMIVDGKMVPRCSLAHRIVHHLVPQGIIFSLNEWIEWLTLTDNYYGGKSERTSDILAMRPYLCTLIQDDVELAPWLFRYIEQHYRHLFDISSWISGYVDKAHSLITSTVRKNVEVQHRTMASAQHLTAKFTTWRELMPIPKLFGEARISPGGKDYAAKTERGNPSRKPRLGSRVEHWLQGDCPKIVTPGGVVILKDGVRHIGEQQSVWN